MFPPTSPSVVTKTIQSYLYTQYQDDDNLQAFVRAYNDATQAYVSWFANINLPIYTGLSGDLLDWVAMGLYGMARPALSSGLSPDIGPFNTLPLNKKPFNYFLNATAPPYVATSDDAFKRILTWAFYKGDGRQFNVRWLKRRIVRFINGTDGEDTDTSNTYNVSVSFAGTVCTITITGALKGPNADVFQKAVQSGALELPFQYSYVVVV